MKHFLLLAAAFCSFNSFAQKTCGTDMVYRDMLKKNPHIAEVRKQSENHKNAFINGSNNVAGTVKIIPVVFHIIHNYGTENISKEQVLDAMRIINEDFRKMNPDTNLIVPAFQSVAADCEIEFRLAQIDPWGNCTDGITRTVSPLTYEADDNVKQLISWDNDMYLNIWVVDNISFGAGGYAYYPGTAPQGGEGIVVLHTQLGDIGTACGTNFCERTLTHEIGHYLNLPHTWGSNNDCGNATACFDDDGITDTPLTSGSCQTCNLSQVTCNTLDNVQNYMDYATCTRMFTLGQKQTMNAALASTVGGRLYLWQSSNLSATGTNTTTPSVCVPVADFIADKTIICSGSSVSFTDLSWNADATSWSWQFPGGTPSSSNDSMPVIVYNVPGIYSVTLTSGTSAGTNIYTRTGYITVEPATAAYSSAYSESFESIAVPGIDWTVSNPDNGAGWQLNTAAGATGTASMRIVNTFNSAGQVDELFGPTVNPSAIPDPIITFKVAFPMTEGSDKLVLYVSRDCGRTWMPRFVKTGAALSTTSTSPASFVPSANEWRMEVANFGPYQNDSNVMLKFRYIYDSGKNIYIDDINVFSNVNGLGIGDMESIYNLGIMPNPAGDHTIVRFTLPSQEKTGLRIYNAVGQEIYAVPASELSKGKHEMVINTSGFARGIYIVELSTGGGALVRRLVVN
jgi:PKD repeat protein